MLIDRIPNHGSLRKAVSDACLMDEKSAIDALMANLRLDVKTQKTINLTAKRLVSDVRGKTQHAGGITAFMQEYDLSSQEGVMLLCLAEALLRIPDAQTTDQFIRDKISQAHWDKHFGSSDSLFVNASTWGLMLTGKIIQIEHEDKDPASMLNHMISKLSEPVVRAALKEAMRIIGQQFVMGQSIESALQRSDSSAFISDLFSFDMLGEAALCTADARCYYDRYLYAIKKLKTSAMEVGDIYTAPSISVKLSGLHPRYEFSQLDRVMHELVPKVYALVVAAKNAGIAITIDAEEAQRLELNLDIFAAVMAESELRGWGGFGMVVQAYQKRAPYLIDWLKDLAAAQDCAIPVRLVKGAYWDTEIKQAQEMGLKGYPVFTRKQYTDVSYLSCAQQLIDAGEGFYPQFATHNAYTIAWLLEMLPERHHFELQRLHGMGEVLYAQLKETSQRSIRCRIYAPVGEHKDLLPYLVRRLLENGANTSFINRISDAKLPVETVIADPVEKVRQSQTRAHEKIPLPIKLFSPQRENSKGINLSDWTELQALHQGLVAFKSKYWFGGSIVKGRLLEGDGTKIVNPADRNHVVGEVQKVSVEIIDTALEIATQAYPMWSATGAQYRAQCLEKVADELQFNAHELISLIVYEAGRSVHDAMAEVREAVDFCRYYASLAKQEFAQPLVLPGPTGESNVLSWHGRGVFSCISPWNFPLAIFCGQIAAALLAGNTVLAKPASFTPLIATKAVQLFHKVGVPVEVLQLILVEGRIAGERMLVDKRIAGVAFTGSIETAQHINFQLATRRSTIAPLVAETGGQNVMIVDSSTLPEQVVVDVLRSAFNSAGQRCSALRVLFLQTEIADHVIDLLTAAMDELVIGNPIRLNTDVGPLISETAKKALLSHMEKMNSDAKVIYQASLSGELENGYFFAPSVVEIPHIGVLEKEVFGPIVHVVRYSSKQLDQVLDSINATGYGLTLGIHSRIEQKAKYIQRRVRVGNTYVNRNMIGAAVGVQPFGGEGLSGTGFKAGGPHYLFRFATERTVTTNIAAIGGNTQLMSTLEDD